MFYSIESVLFLLGISERKYVRTSLASPLLGQKNHQYFAFVCRYSTQPGTEQSAVQDMSTGLLSEVQRRYIIVPVNHSAPATMGRY